MTHILILHASRRQAGRISDIENNVTGILSIRQCAEVSTYPLDNVRERECVCAQTAQRGTYRLTKGFIKIRLVYAFRLKALTTHMLNTRASSAISSVLGRFERGNDVPTRERRKQISVVNWHDLNAGTTYHLESGESRDISSEPSRFQRRDNAPSGERRK